MTGNVQLYLTGEARVLRRMEARLRGLGVWVKARAIYLLAKTVRIYRLVSQNPDE